MLEFNETNQTAPKPSKTSNLLSKDYFWFGLSFLLPLISITTVMMFKGFYPFGKLTLMSGDYLQQYVPIYLTLGKAITSLSFGNLFWSWTKGLGGVMSPVFSFNSISPLTILIALTPIKYLNFSIFLTTVLRHGLSGLTFYYFLHKRYQAKHSPLLALLISFLYGMNGFLIANQINPNFLDNIILFPLLLIGVEKILDGKKSLKYLLVLATMIITHFYTAYMASLFVIVYAFYYLAQASTNLKDKMKQLCRLAGYSLWAVALTFIWLLPLFFALIDTKVAGAASSPWSFSLQHHLKDIILKFIIGASHGNEWSTASALPSFYVGSLSLVGLLHYFSQKSRLKKHKIILAVMLIVLFIIFSNTALIKIMHMGQLPFGFYHRNAWLLSGFLLIPVYQALQIKTSLSLKTTGIWLALIAIASLTIYQSKQQFNFELIANWQLVLSVVLILSIILVLHFNNKGKPWSLLALLLISLFDMGGNAYIILGRSLWNDDAIHLTPEGLVAERYDELAKLSSQLKRVELAHFKTYNDPLMHHYSGVNHFTSSIESRTLEALGKLGLPSSQSMSVYGGGTPLTDALINLSYYFVYHNAWRITPRKIVTNHYHRIKETDQGILLENPYTLGLGFSVSHQLQDLPLVKNEPIKNQNEIGKLLFNIPEDLLTVSSGFRVRTDNLIPDPNNPSILTRNQKEKPATISVTFTPTDDNTFYLYFPKLTDATVKASQFTLNNEPYFVSDRFRNPQLWALTSQNGGKRHDLIITINSDQPIDTSGLQIYRFDDQLFQQQIKINEHIKWQPTSVTSTMISGTIQQPADKDYFITSVPYNQGWTVKIDDQPVNTQISLDGFVSFKLPPGKHQLTMTYIPPGIIIGGLISLLACLPIGYIMLSKNSYYVSKINHNA